MLVPGETADPESSVQRCWMKTDGAVSAWDGVETLLTSNCLTFS